MTARQAFEPQLIEGKAPPDRRRLDLQAAIAQAQSGLETAQWGTA